VNLYKLVAGAVSAINPRVVATIQKSTGYTTNADGSRTPIYAAPVPVRAQKQALQYNDIVQTDGLNLQGERCALYISGNWEGVVRSDGVGGDIITMPDGSVWIVAVVLENWGDAKGWTKVAATKQVS
jgi:hypothetical protein